MRRLESLPYTLLLLFSLLLLASCDPVAEDDRYVVCPVEVNRSILLEEFTGQNCPNCPTAHRTIEALQQQYGDALVSVSIHAGGFALEEGLYAPYYQTFMTPEGDTYASQFGVVTYPSGVVNRMGKAQLYTEWASSVHEAISQPATLAIDLKTETEGDKMKAYVQMLPNQQIEGHLQLWVVEDSIVSIQKEGNVLINNYVHNNVYRAALNGVGGTPVSLQANVYENYSCEAPLHADWNPANLSVIAFVYDARGVCQVAKTSLQSRMNPNQ